METYKDHNAFAGSDANIPNGLTKREYFAGLAMQSLLINGDKPLYIYSRLAVESADHLIDELNKESE